MDNQEVILNRIEDLESRIAILEGNYGRKGEDDSGSQKRQSVKEFFLSKKPTDDVQNTLVFGYFLEKNEGMTSFNIEDLARCFKMAKVQLPSNLNDKVNLNIKKGHLMEASEKKNKMKAWTLTLTGERFIEDDLNRS